MVGDLKEWNAQERFHLDKSIEMSRFFSMIVFKRSAYDISSVANFGENIMKKLADCYCEEVHFLAN